MAPELALDYVSPLPPVRSGIADYSRDLLPHLAAEADVRVARLPGQPVSPEVEERYRPVAAAEVGSGGRLPLYQMGNNPYHEAVWELAGERPGVLTLHDVVLHHLLLHRTLGRRDFAAYRRQLTADHGWIGEAASHPRYHGLEGDAALFALPAHRSLLRRQRGVLVHSRWAAGVVAEDDPEIRVRPVPMGVPLPPPADPAAGAALRRRLGVSEEAVLLGSFGFQTPIKRTATALAALADRRLADCHLLVAGEASPGLDFAALARQAGVADRVHVTGFLPYDDFEAAIAACDLCLNLRYPTAGETSASLLRVLAMGRPAVVSDYAQFAELPEELAVKVPLGEGEAAALAQAVAELLATPERLAAMGRAARRHVERRHDPRAAARAVIAACEEWAELPPPGPAPASVAPPTSLTCCELGVELAVEGAEAPWPAGERRRLVVEAINPGPVRWLAAERGPGGVALEVRLTSTAGALPQPRWLPLPRDVVAGGRTRFELLLRRPPGPAQLTLGLRVLEGPEVVSPPWTGHLA
jgi:glycosyltransferase involved in cell wall biosynthesis